MADVYCIQDFKTQFEKLLDRASYKDLEQGLIDNFINKSIDEVSDGTRLNGSSPFPFIKKRICGSGGYRIYYLLLKVDDKIILSFLHPKRGALGFESLSIQEIAHYQKEAVNCAKKSNLYELKVDSGCIEFVALDKPITTSLK